MVSPVCYLYKDHVHVGKLNDLWQFNISSSLWTWLSGGNIVDSYGVYGTKEVTSSSNFPGSRNGHSMVFDSNLSCIYVFGGVGNAAPGHYGEGT